MQPYIILQKSGFDILFTGILTEKVMDSIKMDELIGSFVTTQEAAAEIGKITNAYKNNDIDLTVVLSHIGYESDIELAKMLKPEWGVDMIIERGWEKILIQLKQWKDPIGLDAIREVHTAINHYKATRAMVICTSTFTQNALELASENNVICLDAKKFLSELYKHGYFLPPQ